MRTQRRSKRRKNGKHAPLRRRKHEDDVEFLQHAPHVVVPSPHMSQGDEHATRNNRATALAHRCVLELPMTSSLQLFMCLSQKLCAHTPQPHGAGSSEQENTQTLQSLSLTTSMRFGRCMSLMYMFSWGFHSRSRVV